jgi:predicted transcriptional regulator of viral defense system
VEEKSTMGTFNISSREKTIIDCMLYPKYCGGLDEAVKGIWKSRQELDFVKLLEYLKRMGVGVVTRRIGYALELLGLAEEISSEIASCRSKGYMWLDPIGPKKVLKYSKKYGLIINRTKDELAGWMGY